jgi:non-heme chloroperoxidase
MREKTFESFDGTKLYYVQKKSKNPHTLIFLHGIGANWTVWKKEVEFFSNKGYSIIALDLRGHGLSEWPHNEDKYIFTNFIDDVHHLIKKEKIKDFSLVGHSIGGAIAITFCQRTNLKPKSLILLDSAHRYPYKKGHDLNMSPVIVNLLRFMAKHEHIENEIFSHLFKNKKKLNKFRDNHYKLFRLLHYAPMTVVFKCLDTVHEYSDKLGYKIEETLKKFDRPTLVIASTNDKIIPAEFSEEIHHLVKGSKLEIMKDAHHSITVDKADEVNNSIYTFLKNYNL